MNREKAIEIFKRLKENAPNEMHLETVGTAQELFEMAIQALSQEPCDDVVSRQAVLDEIEKWVVIELQYTNATPRLIKRINELPSVTQKGDVKNV